MFGMVLRMVVRGGVLSLNLIPCRFPVCKLDMALPVTNPLRWTTFIWLVICRILDRARSDRKMSVFRLMILCTTARNLCRMSGLRLSSGLLTTNSRGWPTNVRTMFIPRWPLEDRLLIPPLSRVLRCLVSLLMQDYLIFLWRPVKHANALPFARPGHRVRLEGRQLTRWWTLIDRPR